MTRTSLRAFTLIEALALVAYISLYIWKLQFAQPNSWIVFPIWLLASIALHCDTPKTLGWRADNLRPAIFQGWKIFVVFAAFAFGAAALFGGYRRWPPLHLTQFHRFLGYFAFCLLQQVALNSYLTNRLLYAFESTTASAFVAGFVFAALHWPNPVLVPLTFIGGATMSWLFAKERNIIPLTIGQAIIGALVWWAFPIAWHHGMRVGPGFYTFHQ